MDEQRLLKDISDAINCAGADAACKIPDTELAQILVGQIKAISAAVNNSIRLGYIRPTEESVTGFPYLVSHLNFSERTTRSLKAHGITTIAELRGMSNQMLLRVPNLGRKSLNEIRTIITQGPAQ